MMNQMLLLPATVEELNIRQHYKSSTTFQLKKADFEDIPVEKRLKREVSLPNGVENWNISNFDSYLNFDDALAENLQEFDVLASPQDRLVPESSNIRDRSSSISSVTSSIMDDKQYTFHNFGGVKTINTVCMDSGSTCISSDHTYFGKSPMLTESLDPEETYQNLDMFCQLVPEITVPETLQSSFSPLPSPSSNDSFDLTVLQTIKSDRQSPLPSFDTPSTSSKRPFETIDEDDVFFIKQTKHEMDEPQYEEVTRYHEIRRKNNLASKNCRKTRKEKQKDLEERMIEEEQKRVSLKMKVDILEKHIAICKKMLFHTFAQKQ